jgi:two-component system, OmpR family, sensor histidine kinase VicK
MTGKAAKQPQRKSAASHQNTAAMSTDTRSLHPAAKLLPERQQVELFAEIVFKIRQSLQLSEILRTIVTEVQRVLQADRVLIYQVLADGTGKPISEAVLPEYQAILGMEFPEEVFPLEYQQRYARGRVRAVADVRDPQADVADCLVEFVEQFGVKAKLIVPILHCVSVQNPRSTPPQTAIWGLLIAHQCDRPRQWADFELELMQQLADQISIALAQGELWEQLEEIVAERTAQLQAVNASLQQEIDDRQQAETALRQSEEQLRLITNALPVLIAYIDDRECYQFNNQAYSDWLGQSLTAMHGTNMRQVWGDNCYERMQPHIQAALGGEVVTYENEIDLIDGSTRSVSVTYIPHRDLEARVSGFFALTSDISDRLAIERMKDEFIAVVSHELRTPLTSLHSALKILATGRLGTLSSDGQQLLAIADENTERLVRLVNSVLDLQRIESGAVTIEKQACNAADLLVQAVEAMQPMAQQHGITLVDRPVDVQIWADADYILQTLTNLISNAIKFSAPGSKVWLTVNDRQPPTSGSKSPRTSKSKAAKASQVVLFQVRDEGQGIPAHKLASVFERFQQVDSSDSRKKGGTGLGLTICRKIIDRHEGKIWVDSTLGVGSTFSFTLPALMRE